MKYLLHSNNSQKKQHSNLSIATDENSEGQISYQTQTPWARTSSTREVMEGCLNLAAGLFMIRPWDYQGLVLLRAMHELNYFSVSYIRS